MSICNVCKSVTTNAFSATILCKHEVSYYHCAECGLLQTETPYWLEEAYSDAIANADTGLVQRNISIATKLASLLYFAFDSKASYLDVAGGYGMLTRLMRDYGFDFYWSDKYCNNLLARGFEEDKAKGQPIALTAFEVLEHIHDPLTFIKETLSKYEAHTLIFTTELYNGTPPTKDWWYYTFSTGQHITFYQHKTFQIIAKELGMNFYSANGIHMLTDKTINRSKYYMLTNRFFTIPIAQYVKNKMSSFTFEDHRNIMNKKGDVSER